MKLGHQKLEILVFSDKVKLPILWSDSATYILQGFEKYTSQQMSFNENEVENAFKRVDFLDPSLYHGRNKFAIKSLITLSLF